MTFRENRFVFQVSEGGSNTPQQSEAPKEQSTVDWLLEKLGIKRSEKMEQLATTTTDKLDELKLEIDKRALFNDLDIDGVKLPVREFNSTVDAEQKFVSDQLAISTEVDRVLSSKSQFLEKWAKKIDENPKNLKDALVQLYTNSLVLIAAQQFEQKFPKYSEYLAAKNSPIDKYELSVGKFFNPQIKFGPENSVAAYDKFVQEEEAKKKAAEAPKPAEAGNPQVKPEEQKTEELTPEKRVEALKTSMLGSFLQMVGYQDEDFAKIAAGAPCLGTFLFAIFNKELLPGGGSMWQTIYNKAKSLVPDQLKPVVDKMENQVKTVVGDLKGESPASTSVEIEADNFKQMLDGKAALPEKDFKLKADYQLEGGKKLQIVVAEGGKIVIPENTVLQIQESDGLKTVKAEPGEIKELPAGNYLVVGKVPKDVVLNGSMQFRLISPEEDAPAKEEPVPAPQTPEN